MNERQGLEFQMLPTLATIITPQVQAALCSILSKFCEIANWDYGEVWMPNQSRTLLELIPVWYISPRISSSPLVSWEQYRLCSQGFILSPGTGLPGRVWSSQQPEWINDTSAKSESYFLRHQISKAFGVKAGLGVPIFTPEGERVAALVFFISEVRSIDPQVIELAQNTAAEFGALLPT